MTKRRGQPRQARPVGVNLHCAKCKRIVCRFVDGGDGFDDIRPGAAVEPLDDARVLLRCRCGFENVVRGMAILDTWRSAYTPGERTDINLGALR